jgi:hypothetical protein
MSYIGQKPTSTTNRVMAPYWEMKKMRRRRKRVIMRV